MTENDFDGIVIGAGQHGLVLASYLARSGLRIALLDRRLTYGGGLSTEERTLPGFYHNLHSINHFSISGTPWFRDLDLRSRGVEYIVPEFEFAQPHADRTALVFSRNIDTTAASIGRFSERDARTFREWNKLAEEMTRDIFMVERYSEPLSPERRAELLERSSIGREFLALTRRQPGEVVEELFDDERVKVLFLFKLSLFGTVLHETLGAGSPAGSLIRAFDLATGYELCRGGSFNLARGLMETFIAAGGSFVPQSHVERIDIVGGTARGVTLSNGRTLRSRFVASTVDVAQTFTSMVDSVDLPAEYRDKVERFRDTQWTIFGVHLALREPPNYLSSAFDPNVNKALKYNIGSETIASLAQAHAEVQAEQLPSRVQFGAGALTQLDPTQAPPGRHTAYAWQIVPFAPDGDPDNLNRIRESFADSIMDKWREYAPNLTPDNILGRYVYTAYDYVRELPNMRRGDIFMGELTAGQIMHNHFGYRTPVDGLYMAGSATHPNGAISGGAGYIAANIIVGDLGLKTWWKPVDAAAGLADLAEANPAPAASEPVQR
jgi:phytoene dehydrogenase-like protein